MESKALTLGRYFFRNHIRSMCTCPADLSWPYVCNFTSVCQKEYHNTLVMKFSSDLIFNVYLSCIWVAAAASVCEIFCLHTSLWLIWKFSLYSHSLLTGFSWLLACVLLCIWMHLQPVISGQHGWTFDVIKSTSHCMKTICIWECEGPWPCCCAGPPCVKRV